MKPEQLVPSLELCQKLKELGFPQKIGLFYWVQTKVDAGFWVWEIIYRQCIGVYEYVAAPTTEELLQYIPDKIEAEDEYFYVYSRNKKITTGYGHHLFHIQKDKLVDSFACALIWLIENRHVRFEDG